jgi:hypothetical protein
MDFIRIWTEVDIKEVINHIIIVDDKFGFCTGCKEIGIKIDNLTNCPKCNREFKYVSSREAKGGAKGIDIVMRIKKKLPALTFIDYDDYERATTKNKADSLFNV